MEKYTETAAVENHTISVDNYFDASNQLCIASDEDCEITFFMRNPKQFSLIPSVNFTNLETEFSRSAVTIEQPEIFTVQLSLPQKFLISVDEGRDITTEINLHEPMSGREFDKYIVNLHCNTKPPVILNPTVLNNSNQTFVLAFDMPNEEEVAIRHKDLAEVVINGQSFPVSVTTVPNPDADSENPDSKIAVYEFSDSHFSRSWSNSYNFLNSKDFVHNKNSVYFETGEAFSAADKEYTIELKDKAGLSSTVKASTSISKLEKPVIKDQSGYEIAEGGLAGIPFDEQSEKGKITIIPPSKDHLGNNISGATVYYKVYEATGNGLIYKSGTTDTELEIELPQNTYRVEAYATLTNYENSSTRTVKFRFMNNTLFVEANAQNGDGSEAAPYATIAEALADINDTENRKTKASIFTIYVAGDFTSDTLDKSGVSGSYGNILLEKEIQTNEIRIKKNPQKAPPILKSIELASTLDSELVVKLEELNVSNDAGFGLTMDASCSLTLSNIKITDCSNTGLRASAGTINFLSGSIKNNTTGILLDNYATLNLSGGTISDNTSGGISLDNTCTLNLEGNPVVYGNTSGSPATPANIILPKDKLINITGAFTSGAKLGISTHADNEPLESPADRRSYSITQNYGTYNTAEPYTIFVSDKDYTFITENGEVSITWTGSAGQIYNASDYNIDFTAENIVTYPGIQKLVSVTPVITRKEISGSTTELYCGTDNKLYLASDHTVKAGGDNVVIWTASLYNGSTLAATLSPQAAGTPLTYKLPALTEGTYSLKLKALYMGLQYNRDLSVTINKSAEAAVDYINTLTTAGTYDVEVTGPVGAGYEAGSEEGLKKVANAIKARPSGVLIDLDASKTSQGTASISMYNSGEYFMGCTALHSISLPNWMSFLIQNLFANCSNLERIENTENIKYIGPFAFKNCTSLKSITFTNEIVGAYNPPNQLYGFDTNAFAGCTSLNEIIFTGTSTDWRTIHRGSDWHTGVPATQVHCLTSNDYCDLDEQ